MPTGWVKSLQCKSRALDDVVSHHASSKHYHYHHLNLIPDSASCRKSVQSLKDVVETTKGKKPKKPKPRDSPQTPPSKRPVSRKPEPAFREPSARVQSNAVTRRPRAVESFLPALAELPAGHPSRNVVEIIFHTSWTPKDFSGRIEMVLKVQNLTRTLTRFEEYREIVKSRAGSGGGGVDHARCVADGNEVMRFYCLGPTNGSAYDAGGGAWVFHGGKGAVLCTFPGSGVAHESAGGGRGRRAMLVCRVIAGRVCKQLGYNSLLEERVEYDSVKRDNGELLVFDSRAVLPCFLIIYKL